MSVSDGQRANEQTFNDAFLSRSEDSDTVAIVGLNRAAGSGALIPDAQLKINDNAGRVTVNENDIATLFLDKEDKNQKGVAGGYPSLDGTGKVPLDQIPDKFASFEGNWDASTNTPTLADGVGNQGQIYVINVAGTQDLGSGSQTFDIGDWVVYRGTDDTWRKVINSTAVTSVNGQTGLVTLGLDDLDDVDLTTTPPIAGQALVYDDISGNWIPGEAAGGSGVGGISYVINPGAEIDTSDWTEYFDGASPTPVDGTGVPGSVFFPVGRSTNATDRIRGDATFTIIKSGVDAQGYGQNIGLETIDPADINKRLQVSFEYKMPNPGGNPYIDGDYQIFIYDVDNAALIGAVENDDGGTILRSEDITKFVGFFNSTDSLNYRLLLHVTTSDTTSTAIAIDNVQLGPVGFVPVVLQYEETIDVTGSGAFTGGTIKVSRIGNQVNIQTETDLTFAAQSTPTSADGILPEWARPNINRWNLYINNGANYVARANVTPAGAFAVDFSNWDGSDDATETTDSSFMSLSYSVDGKTNVVSNTELTQQTVRVTGQASSASHTGTGGYQNVDFTKDRDTHNAYDGTTFVAPRDGFYNFSAYIQFASNASGRRGVRWLLTGADDGDIPGNLLPASATGSFGILSTGMVFMVKGGTAILQAFQDSGGNLNYGTGNISIMGMPNFTSYGVVKNPVPAVKAIMSASQSVVVTSTVVVEFDSIEYDTNDGWNFANNNYVVPEDGIYFANYALLLNNHSAGNNYIKTIYVNGVVQKYYRETNTGGNPDTEHSSPLNLKKGDVVDARIQNDDGNYFAGGVQGFRSYFSLFKVTT